MVPWWTLPIAAIVGIVLWILLERRIWGGIQIRPSASDELRRKLDLCRKSLRNQREAMFSLYTEEDARSELTALAEKVKHILLLIKMTEEKATIDQKLLDDLNAQFGAASKEFYDKRDAIFTALGLEFSINPNDYVPKLLR